MENTEKSSAPVGGGGAKEKVEKQARQLAYDVRYKVRGALKAQSGGKSDPATVKKAYMSQLAKSPAAPAIKTRAKQMLVGEDYINMKGIVADGVASAMYKVFVEHHQKDAEGNTIPHEEINEDEVKEKTYKVRVTDKETGNSYVRNATRAKIAELRNNPNISSVEMTEYGEVTKSEKYKGSKTASVKSGKGVDYDGDGKKESSSKEHAGVVHNAIQKKKGGTPDGKDTRKENYTWKEAFGGLIEKKSEEEEKKITGKGVNNKNLIKVFPDDVKEDAEYGYDKEGNSLNPEDIKKKNEKDPNGKAKKEEDEDPRSIPTKMNLVKNKLRAMGLKMSHEPEGKLVEGKKKGLDGKECWDGYKLAGTKKKGGKTVDNCVKSEGYKGTADLSKADPDAKKKVEDRIAKHVGTKRVPGGKMGVKEETNSTVQSALDSLNSYHTKNEKLHGSLIHNEDAALDFVKKKIEREHGKGAYVSKDNPRKPQSAADKTKARAHQAKVDAENAAERKKDPSQGRYPKG